MNLSIITLRITAQVVVLTKLIDQYIVMWRGASSKRREKEEEGGEECAAESGYPSTLASVFGTSPGMIWK